MTKVAISFSGQPRIIPYAIESWKELISRYDADVFIHTWNDNNFSAQSLIETFSPKLSIIDEPLEFELNKYRERLIYSNPYSVFSMWTSISRSFNLTTSYNDYDIIIRGRFDVAFNTLNLISTDGIVIPGKPPEKYNYLNKHFNGWHDMFAYGDPKSMNIYCHTLDMISDLYDQGGPFFSEYFLSATLHLLNAKVIHQDIWADIVK